jgi:hypothetical protein
MVSWRKRLKGRIRLPPKVITVRRIINDQVGAFELSEIAAQVPGISLGLAKRILATMKKEGALTVSGRGRNVVREVIRKS